MKKWVLPWVILLCVGCVVGQPGGGPKTYAAAKTEAEKWVAAGDYFKANPAIKKAFDLAKTNDEKVEATLMYAGRVVRFDSEATGSRRYYKYNEAYQLYQDAMKMPGLSQAKVDELRLAAADLVADAVKGSLVPPSFTDRIRTQSNRSLVDHARAEYTAMIESASTSGSIKTRSFIGRAKTRDTAIVFGNIKKEEVMAAFADLKAGAEVAGAPDPDKATAWFEIVDLATTISDANAVAAGYENVTKLVNAKNDQKIKAYRGLIELMLGNNMIKASKDQLVAANKIVGLSREQKAVLLRLAALIYMVDVDPSDPAAFAKAKKAAIAELDKAVAVPKLSDEDKFKTYSETGAYLKQMKVAVDLAVDQLEKAMKLPTIKEDRKAEAQYEIGEAYRINGRNAEAKAAYLKVSNANQRYYNYAQSRLKEVGGAPTQ